MGERNPDPQSESFGLLFGSSLGPTFDFLDESGRPSLEIADMASEFLAVAIDQWIRKVKT